MNRLYLMPISGSGTGPSDPRGPKYLSSILTPNSVVWSMMDYGNRPVCLLAANTDVSVHALLISNTDVYAFPDEFESSGVTVGNQANTLSNTLESYGIPAQWVANQSSYRTVAHTVGAMFQYLQRLNGITGNIDPFTGVTLNSKISDLAPGTADAMFAAGNSFGWNMSGVTNQTTLRNFIKYMADQWGATPLLLGGFAF